MASVWRNGAGARQQGPRDRMRFLGFFFLLLGVVASYRLFTLQVLSFGSYSERAEDSREIFQRLLPARGTIFVRDQGNALYPVATNRDTFDVIANPRLVGDASSTAHAIAPLLALDAVSLEEKISTTSSYARLAKGISEDLMHQLQTLFDEQHIVGITFSRVPSRYYPESGMGGQLLGFVGQNEQGDREGKYGLEGYWNPELSGTAGVIAAQRDVAGRWIPVADHTYVPAVDGADLVLTIDRALQRFVCGKVAEAVQKNGAAGGSAVVLDTATGAVLALCGSPDFDPNTYNKVDDISVYNNPVTFAQYEPGSVMKTMTLAAGIDAGKITPNSTYTDEGEIKIGPFTIRNSDKKAHGVQTMTQVLEESLNTGAIYVQRALGAEVFRTYLQQFGFGTAVGIEAQKEVAGDLSSLEKRGDIYPATASYGQGISATTLQLAAAYAAIANKGVLMKSHVVEEVRWPDGKVDAYAPKVVRRVLSERTASQIGSMLISVVEKGHGKKAGVAGYWVAGKTGTAQIAQRGGGYEVGANIGTFAGYFPADAPRWAVVTRVDRPHDVAFAESSAAPLFHDIAQYLLTYHHLQPNR